MMKLKMLLGVAALASTTAVAQGPQCNHAQLPFQQMTPVPYDSTPYSPQDTMPEQCSNPEVEAYIADWEAGKIDFTTIQANDSIAADQRFCKTLDDDGNILEVKDCDRTKSPVGYIWKELSDSPVVIGITDGGKSDHAPHFHGQPECYYVVNGEGQTLADNQFKKLGTGQYFYIPGATIHNTPIMSDKGLGVIYWYPNNAHFDGFKYYWRKDVKNLRVAEEAFDRVDAIRKRDLNLGPYGTNQAFFKK
ncbi:cupin domain-containing protein [Shewanella insulae]|uniref:Cupin domain-containing protein n=1 Tax=Shewanella insulae TaxID=2681496 RepID=A0A6L7I2L5_9GAMM|nr:cupin domain-containing protein [Shewanella insulae]MCG9714758.1 cupin domain-containing protein [Shewanella insulae]MCG9740096.1 cupin domain-containing protein [Shewanella insulae]MCG9756966.1 cupin domain-containing protein [Shewanella insulae]MXR70520.1 cupin domain-containing protein [Shewanella insulae]